jgi:molybdopterin converting factor small subunit
VQLTPAALLRLAVDEHDRRRQQRADVAAGVDETGRLEQLAEADDLAAEDDLVFHADKRRIGTTVQVRVRLVAGLSKLAGRPRLELRLEDGATVADLLRRLGEDNPQLAPGLPSALPVVAGSHVPRDRRLADGEEVALLSPVAGGAQPTGEVERWR